MEAWQERVVAELRDLKEKVLRLEAFLTSKQMDNLDVEDKLLLRQQLRIMLDYKDVLQRRIERFQK